MELETRIIILAPGDLLFGWWRKRLWIQENVVGNAADRKSETEAEARSPRCLPSGNSHHHHHHHHIIIIITTINISSSSSPPSTYHHHHHHIIIIIIQRMWANVCLCHVLEQIPQLFISFSRSPLLCVGQAPFLLFSLQRMPRCLVFNTGAFVWVKKANTEYSPVSLFSLVS